MALNWKILKSWHWKNKLESPNAKHARWTRQTNYKDRKRKEVEIHRPSGTMTTTFTSNERPRRNVRCLDLFETWTETLWNAVVPFLTLATMWRCPYVVLVCYRRGCCVFWHEVALRWLHAITYRIFDPSIRIVAQSACHSNCSRAWILLEHELSINKLQTDEMIWCTRVIDCIQQDCVGNERTESHGDRKPETKVKIPLKCSVWKMDPLIHILKLLSVAAVSSSRVHVARRRW